MFLDARNPVIPAYAVWHWKFPVHTAGGVVKTHTVPGDQRVEFFGGTARDMWKSSFETVRGRKRDITVVNTYFSEQLKDEQSTGELAQRIPDEVARYIVLYML